jgi:hypothetical protein
MYIHASINTCCHSSHEEPTSKILEKKLQSGSHLGVVQEEEAVDLEVNIGQKQAVDLDLRGHGHP